MTSEVSKVAIVEPEKIKLYVMAIASKREALVRLLEQPNLGTLRIDVNQALEELDELVEELHRAFPETGETL